MSQALLTEMRQLWSEDQSIKEIRLWWEGRIDS